MNYPYLSRRVGATVIDYTVIFLFMFVYVDCFGVNDGAGSYTVNGWPALGPIAFWFAYFILAERYMGGTLGHQLQKLKVVSRDGNDLTLGQVTKRRLCDALEIVWCSGLIAWLLVRSTEHYQRLGDLVAKTMVIGRDDAQTNIDFDFEKG
jgi:uncharacterized RDD family membrane protein YckC